MSKYSKEKAEILAQKQELQQKRRTIIKQGEEDREKALSGLSLQERVLALDVSIVKNKYELLSWVAKGLAIPISIIVDVIIYKLGFLDLFPPLSVILFLGIIVGGWFGFYALIYYLIFGWVFIKRKLKNLEKNQFVKAYQVANERANRAEREINEQIEKLEEQYKQYVKWEKGEKVFNIIGKGISFIEEMGESATRTSSSNYTHSVNDGGYKTNLKLDERQGGYDTEHGWHDTYKDEHGRSWGSTDGGKTFFKKD